MLHRKSLTSHEVTNNQSRVGDVEDQATENTLAHMVLVKYPRRTFFAQITGEGVAKVRVVGQIEPKRQERRNDIVELDFKRLRINAKFEFHVSLLNA
ncbi:hypothetical protein AWB78_04330 [Caballeronia calidae]|uniref:Uncharacterized protein n=1 Tax=Caballeronia calidae TaxID=1777139 RepID=A0A158CTZ4_9BURK|nr:hypothetical protein AWB78_04330 [Caballeronia calidae]